MRKELPDRGELVICTVAKAKGFGAFVELEEYPDKKGFIHIKEVATGWVKNIREYVREGQRIVCKVMDIDPSKGYVDLSLKRVNDHQKREKIQQWKNEQKAQKLFEMVADKLGLDVATCYLQFGDSLIQKFGSLYLAFEEAASEDFSVSKEQLESDWVEAFVETARENIIIPFVEIKGFLEMTSKQPNGIIHIKEALELAEGKVDPIEIKVKYVSAPLYRVEVYAPDYKSAEKELKTRIDKVLQHITTNGGTGKFMRELK